MVTLRNRAKKLSILHDHGVEWPAFSFVSLEFHSVAAKDLARTVVFVTNEHDLVLLHDSQGVSRQELLKLDRLQWSAKDLKTFKLNRRPKRAWPLTSVGPNLSTLATDFLSWTHLSTGLGISRTIIGLVISSKWRAMSWRGLGNL